MNEFAPAATVRKAFSRFRKPFGLGMQEYLCALKAIAGGWGDEPDRLKQTLILLWCRSWSDRTELESSWPSLIVRIFRKKTDLPALERPAPTDNNVREPDRNIREKDVESAGSPARNASDADPSAEQVVPPDRNPQSPQPAPPEPQIHPEARSTAFAPLPLKAPVCERPEPEPFPEPQTYWPVTRRSMAYGWRYLRRATRSGLESLLDVEATVDRAASQGFFLEPVYRRREDNQARLLLLVDRDGSMVPLHRFTDDLADTAREDATLASVEVFYFHNVPSEYVYRDARLASPIKLKEVLGRCDRETSVLIVSDAGAARGRRSMERIRATTQFLVTLQWKTSLVGWLNPIPCDRWQNSSAEAISYLVPMQEMNEDGFGNAIDIVRGVRN